MTEYESEDDSSDAQCPTCEKTFTSDKGVKIHHKRMHGTSIAGTVVSCTWCGESKRMDTWRAGQAEHHFCDDDCRGEWLAETQTGRNHPNWKEKVTLFCENCDAPFDVIPARAERDGHHFCSQKCHGEWVSENKTGKNANAWGGGETLDCSICGSELTIPEREVERYDRHFCDVGCHAEWKATHQTGEANPLWKPSVDVECANCGATKGVHLSEYEKNDLFFCDNACRGEWQTENLVGESHPRWAGGPFPYGEGWTETKREHIREQQGRECAGCGIHESELARKLDVHHIIPARSFDDDKARNDESNLVALCRRCHRRYEGVPLRPQLAD